MDGLTDGMMRLFKQGPSIRDELLSLTFDMSSLETFTLKNMPKNEYDKLPKNLRDLLQWIA